MFKHAITPAAACLIVGVGSLAHGDQWSHLAGDVARSGQAIRGPADLTQPAWVATPEPNERFIARSSPVVALGRVFIVARLIVDNAHVKNLAIAFDASSGERLWGEEFERDYLDSRSSPAVDERNGLLLAPSGYGLYAIDIETGDVAWSTPLPNRIVNAAPLVTSDLKVAEVHANRAFISDYTGPGGGGSLYAINVDPFDATGNPYEPGEIVWSAPIGGTSGATPAYDGGRVFVASYEPTFVPPDQFVYLGEVRAFDALSGDEIWRTPVQGDDGFFGGVTVSGGAIYAATYDFNGTGNNSRLFKLSAADGAFQWAAECERTTAIPVVQDRAIYLSAGIDGFGSGVKVQCFVDFDSFAELVWDSYVDTGGDLVIGGWTFQPALARGLLYVGEPNLGSFFGPYRRLLAIDVERLPGEPGFIVTEHTGAGGSPALDCGRAYSIGEAGLVAFDTPLPCIADLDGNGAVGQGDLGMLLACFEDSPLSGGGRDPCVQVDLNCDGQVNQADLGILLAEWGEACR